MSKYTEKNKARKGHNKNGETRLARQLRRTLLVGDTPDEGQRPIYGPGGSKPYTHGAFGLADKGLFNRLAIGTAGEEAR
jgi:hypothetical protein